MFIIARVYRVHDDPNIALYADPWTLHERNLISLEPEGAFQGVISRAAQAMILQNSVRSGSRSEINEIYRNLDIGMDHIRLIELEFSADEKPLKGRLIRASIESLDETAFWAISYVWALHLRQISRLISRPKMEKF